jgi:hypothetical protein
MPCWCPYRTGAKAYRVVPTIAQMVQFPTSIERCYFEGLSQRCVGARRDLRLTFSHASRSSMPGTVDFSAIPVR